MYIFVRYFVDLETIYWICRCCLNPTKASAELEQMQKTDSGFRGAELVISGLDPNMFMCKNGPVKVQT